MSINIGDKPEFNVVNVGEEITSDQLAAIQNAAGATASNPLTTLNKLKDEVINPNRIHLATAVFTASSSGTGASGTQLFNSRAVVAPTSAIGQGVLYYSLLISSRGRSYNSRIDWSKRNEFSWLFAKGVSGVTDPNTIGRIVIGKTSLTGTAGDPTGNAVGIRFVGNGVVELIVHNGTTLTAVSTSRTVINTFFVEYKIVSDGIGNVTLFENDIQVATTSAGPTDTLTGSNNFTLEAENIASITGTSMAFNISNFSANFGY